MPVRVRPPPKPSALVRAGRAIAGAVQRFLGVGIPVFSRGGAGIPTSPSYPVEASMRAMRSNPWVWASVQAVSTDLAGLPLVAETGTGVDRKQTTDHWLLRLLERPSPKVSGRKFRKQLVADLRFGEAYVRIWRDATGRPVQFGRIPPRMIKPRVAENGEEVGYDLQDGTELRWDQVLHIADIAIDDDAGVVHGCSPIEPLALSLQVDRDARKQAGRSAKRGRLEMMASPRADNITLGEDRVSAMVADYANTTENGLGLWVVNTGMEATPLTLTAREMEFSATSGQTRGEVLAVMGVPETRVGSPAANYGTSREQSRIYWSTLQGIAALIDDEFSRLAEPGTVIRHSFAGVEALQPSRTERQARGVVWMREYGLSAADAARYEGFVDLPTPTAKPASSSTDVAPPSSSGVDEPRKAAIEATLKVLAGLLQGDEPDQFATAARSLLRSTLQGLGVQRDLAEAVADEAADACVEVAKSAEDNLVDLCAFRREHAERIARIAGLAEAA